MVPQQWELVIKVELSQIASRQCAFHTWTLCVTLKSPKGLLKTRICTFGIAFHIFLVGNRKHFKFGTWAEHSKSHIYYMLYAMSNVSSSHDTACSLVWWLLICCDEKLHCCRGTEQHAMLVRSCYVWRRVGVWPWSCPFYGWFVILMLGPDIACVQNLTTLASAILEIGLVPTKI